MRCRSAPNSASETRPASSVAITCSLSNPAREGLEPSKFPCQFGNSYNSDRKKKKSSNSTSRKVPWGDTHSTHQLLLAAPGDGDTPRTLPLPEHRVLRGAQRLFRYLVVLDLDVRMGERLPLAVEKDVHPLYGLFKPGANSRRGDILRNSQSLIHIRKKVVID
jgi:hypothetical protein